MGDKSPGKELLDWFARGGGPPREDCPSCRPGRCATPPPAPAAPKPAPAPDPQPGTRDWWLRDSPWVLRGTVDSILRLFEQGEIARSKAQGLLRYALVGKVLDNNAKHAPKAPWDKLSWCQEDDDGR